MVTPDNIPTLDGYTYVSTLGRGGFSDVHLFQQRFPRRKVAVKVLRIDELDAALRRQFVAEANVMARLSSHPAIATIFTADISAAGDPYLVMEYHALGSLSNGYRDAPLSVEDVLRHGVRIATALEHAHRGGVVHRDVKPANILLNDYGAAVLTDFGISVGDEADGETTILRASRASVESQTSAAGSHGLSVPWAPPEALADNPVSDARSDVYSLGATLYTLLEGRTPFEVVGASNGALQLSRRIERGEVGAFERDAPDELRELLQSMMATEPGARPGSGQEVAESLQAIQREQALAVTPIELHATEDAEPGSESEVAEAEPTVRRSDLDEIDVETRPRADRVASGTRLSIASTRAALQRGLSAFAQSKLFLQMAEASARVTTAIRTLVRKRPRWSRPRVLIAVGALIVIVGASGGFLSLHVTYVPACDAEIMTALGDGWAPRGFVVDDPVAHSIPSLVCGAGKDDERLYIASDDARSHVWKSLQADDWKCSWATETGWVAECRRAREKVSSYNGDSLRLYRYPIIHSPTREPVSWIRHYLG